MQSTCKIHAAQVPIDRIETAHNIFSTLHTFHQNNNITISTSACFIYFTSIHKTLYVASIYLIATVSLTSLLVYSVT